MDSPLAASLAVSKVQYAIKSPVVPDAADTTAQWVTFGGSAENGPKVIVAELEVRDGSDDGAENAQIWRAYPEVVTSDMVARVVASVGAAVSNAK